MLKKKEEEPFIIAEVGQNHQGKLDIAKNYIKVFSSAGANAIKFQIRSNKHLFSEEAYNNPYQSENSFGKTYGQHREKLELTFKDFKILKKECIKHKVKFIITPFDEISLNLVKKLNVDAIKIASFDIGNLPFLNKITKLNKPIIISIGGAKEEQIRESIKVLKKNKKQIIILHCVSEYPCEFNRLGLKNIINLKKNYKNFVIGSSDHFNGILSGPVAYLMGARVFEKHVTLNRAWVGTDHSFSLEPEGFKKFVRDIKRVRYMLDPKPYKELGNEKVFQKLGKSLIANKKIIRGEKFTFDNLSGKIFSKQYIPVRDSHKVIGKKAKKNFFLGDPIEI